MEKLDVTEIISEEDIKKLAESELTPTQKAQRTRKKHEKARKAKFREEREIREKMKYQCVSIMENDRLTPVERLDAMKILNDLMKGW